MRLKYTIMPTGTTMKNSCHAIAGIEHRNGTSCKKLFTNRFIGLIALRFLSANKDIPDHHNQLLHAQNALHFAQILE